jgi:hypothetical protein
MRKWNKKPLFGLLLLLAAVGGCWFSSKSKESRKPQMVGSKENVTIISPDGQLTNVVAKIDTGADFSSIDASLAQALHLKTRPGMQKTIMTAVGPEKRDTVQLIFVLGNRTISTFATVADRSELSTPLLIGRRNLGRVRVNSRKQFIAPPGAPHIPSPAQSMIQEFLESPDKEILFIFPILGGVIVLMRLLVGIKTYGLFAPVVIAFSLLNQNVFEGMLLYIALVLLGIAIKLIFLNRLKLPQISEMSLLMFASVTLTLGAVMLSGRLNFLIADIFFPMIITSLLIEHATKTVEEHRTADAVFLLLSTVAVASVLAASGKMLLQMETQSLAIIFVVTILAVIAVCYYQGLRLTELLRFKTVRKSHE